MGRGDSYVNTPSFGRDNLAGARFEQVQVGSAVQFIAEVAALGLQAKRVSLGKHHVA